MLEGAHILGVGLAVPCFILLSSKFRKMLLKAQDRLNSDREPKLYNLSMSCFDFIHSRYPRFMRSNTSLDLRLVSNLGDMNTVPQISKLGLPN